MPRQKRVEYEGAIYHVMARGDRLDKIVKSDEDREVFEKTLAEVVAKTGWLVYAYALMGNHYHLVFKTPKANLVEGMTWFQSTVTKRHNARNRLRGHLFSGRYKAVLVEENEYLSTLIHYVHLNPVRAKIIKVADGIENYKWCSLIDFISPPKKRRGWLAVAAGLAHLGYADTASERRKFLQETESLISKNALKRAGMIKMEGASKQVTLERGWCFGSDAFREKVSLLMGASSPDFGSEGSKANGYSAEQIKDHSEVAARDYLLKGLEVFELSIDELKEKPKSDWRKGMLARLIRENTSVKLDWITQELNMGVRSGVAKAERKLTEMMKTDKELQRIWRALN